MIEEKPTDLSTTIFWGTKEIGRAIGRPPRATFHLLETGKLPAKKIGRRWVATKENLDQFFAEIRK